MTLYPEKEGERHRTAGRGGCTATHLFQVPDVRALDKYCWLMYCNAMG
jgi:hypothetical protein